VRLPSTTGRFLQLRPERKQTMNSIKWCFLVITFFLTTCATAWAGEFGEFTYGSSGSNVTITGYTGPGGDVIIPETIDGQAVTSIGDMAFYGCTRLTSVTIPNGVSSIGSGAFYLCTCLHSVSIPDSVNRIGAAAFQSCQSLNAVAIPLGVTAIGATAFFNCTGLESVNIPDSVTSIGSAAFKNCTGLASVAIGNSVMSVGEEAFRGCTSLVNVTIADGVGTIGASAFRNCRNLINITIGDGLVAIGDWAFADCTDLSNIAIPDSVTSIGDWAFADCTGLSNIAIPASVTSIGDGAFGGCTSLSAIDVAPLNSVYSSLDGVLFNKNQRTLIQCPGGKTGGYTIPISVTSIEGSALSGCTSLTSIVIPDSVTCIGPETFWGCISLTNVVIPDSVTSIGDWAFADCTGLTSVVIPDSVTSIGRGAFINCSSLNRLTIGNGLSSIESHAFQMCESLTHVTIPNGVTRIGVYAFYECRSLTSITIPDTVTSIEFYAFGDCSSLRELYFFGNAPTAGRDVFFSYGNESPRVYCLPGTTGWGTTFTGLPVSMWNPQTGWAYVVHNGTISITKYLGAESDPHIPQTIDDLPVTSIGERVYSDSGRLTSITIPVSVTSLGEQAFYACPRLAGVYFEGNAPAVGQESEGFDGCPAVIVYYREGTAGWSATFGGRPTALWIEPPIYGEWLLSTVLSTQYPDATTETDDADQDGMSNYAEMLAGTDPADAASLLTLERLPRPGDLAEEDQTPIEDTQHALYFQSVPGKSYGVQWTYSLEGPWNTAGVVTATTTQKRLVFERPSVTDWGWGRRDRVSRAFYRVTLAQ
jgi:hypothetical protein